MSSQRQTVHPLSKWGIKLSFYLCCVLFISSCISAKRPPPPPSDNQVLVSQFEDGGLIAKETERGVLVYLPSIMFVVGSDDLSDPAKEKVRFIADVSNNSIALDRGILIEAHTDSKGSEQDNMLLSESRAKSVSQLLSRHQISAERIESAWFGETRPLVPNLLSDGTDNLEGQTTNRRVEFILLNAPQ